MEIYKYFDDVQNYYYKENNLTIFEIVGYKFPHSKYVIQIEEDLTDENDEDIKGIINENKKILEELLELELESNKFKEMFLNEDDEDYN